MTDRRAAETLTPREREVLGMVAGGHLQKQIAAELGIAQRTVEVHLAHARQKLGARTVAQAAIRFFTSAPELAQ